MRTVKRVALRFRAKLENYMPGLAKLTSRAKRVIRGEVEDGRRKIVWPKKAVGEGYMVECDLISRRPPELECTVVGEGKGARRVLEAFFAGRTSYVPVEADVPKDFGRAYCNLLIHAAIVPDLDPLNDIRLEGLVIEAGGGADARHVLSLLEKFGFEGRKQVRILERSPDKTIIVAGGGPSGPPCIMELTEDKSVIMCDWSLLKSMGPAPSILLNPIPVVLGVELKCDVDMPIDRYPPELEEWVSAEPSWPPPPELEEYFEPVLEALKDYEPEPERVEESTGAYMLWARAKLPFKYPFVVEGGKGDKEA